MRRIIIAIMFFILIGCSNNESNQKNNQIEVSNTDNPQVAKMISHNDDTDEEEMIVDPFWENYTGEELLEAVEEGSKKYDYETEAPLFEEALIEYISNSEEIEEDWIHYISSFSSNLGDQPHDDYAYEMYKSAMSLSRGNKEEALEHIEIAREIREESE